LDDANDGNVAEDRNVDGDDADEKNDDGHHNDTGHGVGDCGHFVTTWRAACSDVYHNNNVVDDTIRMKFKDRALETSDNALHSDTERLAYLVAV